MSRRIMNSALLTVGLLAACSPSSIPTAVLPYCALDCHMRQLGTSPQNIFQVQEGRLYVHLRARLSIEKMNAALQSLGGNLECLDSPQFAEVLPGERCYVVRVSTQQCLSDVKQLIKATIPEVSSVSLPDPRPENLCACWDRYGILKQPENGQFVWEEKVGKFGCLN